MARKHNGRKIHYGGPVETACGRKWPNLGHGVTPERHKVTCQGCLSVLAIAASAERDDHSHEQCRIALREYRVAMGTGDVRPARRLGDRQADATLPLRRPGASPGADEGRLCRVV